MKVYTEEQVKQLAYHMVIAFSLPKSKEQVDLLFKEHLTPIELPSDEEIDKLGGSGMHNGYNAGLKDGAIWMREQILNQNI